MNLLEDVRKESDAKRKTIIERDGGKCVICGSGSPLEVHHKLAVHKGGGAEDNNLVTLCKICHKHAPEDGKKSFEEYRKAPGLSIWKRINQRAGLNEQIKLGFFQYISEKLNEWHNSGYITEHIKNRLLIREAEDLEREFESYKS